MLYEDAQDGYDYNKGRFSLSTFTLRGKETELIVQQHKEGKFVTPYQRFKINLHGLPFTVKSIELDNEVIPFEKVSFDGQNTLVIDKDFSELHLIGG
jgi:alpha-glucosidase